MSEETLSQAQRYILENMLFEKWRPMSNDDPQAWRKVEEELAEADRRGTIVKLFRSFDPLTSRAMRENDVPVTEQMFGDGSIAIVAIDERTGEFGYFEVVGYELDTEKFGAAGHRRTDSAVRVHSSPDVKPRTFADRYSTERNRKSRNLLTEAQLFILECTLFERWLAQLRDPGLARAKVDEEIDQAKTRIELWALYQSLPPLAPEDLTDDDILSARHIFDDGSEAICAYNEKSGEMRMVEITLDEDKTGRPNDSE